MSEKVIINPLTRISGFLQIEVEISNHVIVDAKSSGMMFRGFEKMLKGRSPLDAIYFTERICGICSAAHSMASAMALENAYQISIDKNSQLLRDFIHGTEFLQNHLRHFYQYTLPDYVNIPDLNPKTGMEESDYRLPLKINDTLAKHYIESLKYSRLAHEMQAVLGGKAPHNHGVFVGGVSSGLDISKLLKLKFILNQIKTFVSEMMIPDVYIIAEYYPEGFDNGKGYGNFLTYGIFDTFKDPDLFYVSSKVFTEGKISDFNEDLITENINRSWYEGTMQTSKPTEDLQEDNMQKPDAYTFIKAPRYGGKTFEVGPLARMWICGDYRRGISTMDRTIARALETLKIINIMETILNKVALETVNPPKFDQAGDKFGRGLIDTTRGALGHWLSISEQKIKHYSIISPSTWNLSPEDVMGIKGVSEQALMGTTIKNTKNPVEIGRIIRSFDPCVSCATHVVSDKFKPFEMRIV